MSGRSAPDILWPDAELHGLHVDYDTVRVHLGESTGRQVVLVAEGYIGYEHLGAWDEVVVESARFDDPAHLARFETALTSTGGASHPSGSVARNRGSWRCLTVHFIDGSELRVAAADFHLEPADDRTT